MSRQVITGEIIRQQKAVSLRHSASGGKEECDLRAGRENGVKHCVPEPDPDVVMS